LKGKSGNSFKKSEIHDFHPKKHSAGARAKAMTNLLQKQLKFDERSYLRCHSGGAKNSGRQMMNGIEKFDRKFGNSEN
jgi:hypothetical protein